MARPKSEYPTQRELEVLQILWDQGPSTIGSIHEVLSKRREVPRTLVASRLNKMAEKGLLTYGELQGRTLLYRAKVARDRTLTEIVEDLVESAFGGSAGALVLHVLDQCQPSAEEMSQIAKAVRKHTNKKREQ